MLAMKAMSKTAGIVLILIGLVIIFLAIISMNEQPADEAGTSMTAVERHFVEEIKAQTLERIDAQPIEGLEQSMYMQAYPGLKESDFVGVETLGDTNENDVQTSADAMITDAGLVILLENVASRLELEISSTAQIDALLAAISQEIDSSVGTSTDATSTDSESDSVDNPDDEEGESLAESCAAADGNWLEQHNECEYVSSQWCSDQGGTYAACESACRHNPDTEICTMQCVPVCEF